MGQVLLMGVLTFEANCCFWMITYMDWPRGYKTFSCSTQLRMKFQMLINSKILIKKFLALSLSDVGFIMLMNVKMPTIVGILTLMSRINFMLSGIEYENSFITSAPDYLITLVNVNAPVVATMSWWLHFSAPVVA